VPGKRILLLGGTTEARDLAGLLLQEGFHPITSFAGVTTSPKQPLGEVRIGGFGGVGGLARYCSDATIAAIVDATHPFAGQISRHAAEVAHTLRLPIVRLERPGWTEGQGDRWRRVADIVSAVSTVPEGARVFLTIGRKEASAFFERLGISGVARMIESPPEPVPPNWKLILARPPFTLADECALMKAERIDCVVCKDAGGDGTRAKLDAARELYIPVIMVARPAKPKVPTVETPEAVGALLRDFRIT
jgi:precorrin-6A/cobalt-precorrin-6A reductase